MVSISGGTYLRGDEDINRARPVHPVRLDAFELCRFPVTQALWEAVIGENPSAFPSTQRPVEKISWEDC
ncbi:MAG: SUMF1/EgtB/PvdO family nonheme iron enzyme, partial [Bacteroidota bacterium]